MNKMKDKLFIATFLTLSTLSTVAWLTLIVWGVQRLANVL